MLDLTKRIYFETLAQVNAAVVPEVTGSNADTSSLTAALESAAAAVAVLFPAAAIHYAVFGYQNISGGWVFQIDLYRGEANPMNHWDTAVTVNLVLTDGVYIADVSTLQTLNHVQPHSQV